MKEIPYHILPEHTTHERTGSYHTVTCHNSSEPTEPYPSLRRFYHTLTNPNKSNSNTPHPNIPNPTRPDPSQRGFDIMLFKHNCHIF